MSSQYSIALLKAAYDDHLKADGAEHRWKNKFLIDYIDEEDYRNIEQWLKRHEINDCCFVRPYTSGKTSYFFILGSDKEIFESALGQESGIIEFLVAEVKAAYEASIIEGVRKPPLERPTDRKLVEVDPPTRERVMFYFHLPPTFKMPGMNGGKAKIINDFLRERGLSGAGVECIMANTGDCRFSVGEDRKLFEKSIGYNPLVQALPEVESAYRTAKARDSNASSFRVSLTGVEAVEMDRLLNENVGEGAGVVGLAHLLIPRDERTYVIFVGNDQRRFEATLDRELHDIKARQPARQDDHTKPRSDGRDGRQR